MTVGKHVYHASTAIIYVETSEFALCILKYTLINVRNEHKYQQSCLYQRVRVHFLDCVFYILDFVTLW